MCTHISKGSQVKKNLLGVHSKQAIMENVRMNHPFEFECCKISNIVLYKELIIKCAYYLK